MTTVTQRQSELSVGTSPESKSRAAELRRIKHLRKRGEHDEARRILQRLLMEPGADAKILSMLAIIDRKERRHAEAAAALKLAHEMRPRSVKLAAQYLDALYFVGHPITALRTFESLPKAMRGKRAIQFELVYIYKALGWRGNEDLVRRRNKFPRGSRKEVVWSAILPLFRWMFLKFEEAERTSILHFSSNLETLDTITFNTLQQAADTKREVERFRLKEDRRWHVQSIIADLLNAIFWATVAVGVLVLGLQNPVVQGFGSLAWTSAVALCIATLFSVMIENVYHRVPPLTGDGLLVVGCALVAGGGILMLARASLLLHAIAIGFTISGLATAVAVVFSALLQPFNRYRMEVLRLANARVAALYALLGMVWDINQYRLTGRPFNQADWSSSLSGASRFVSAINMSTPSAMRDPETDRWLSVRASGACASLRRMKRMLGGPLEMNLPRFSTLLERHILALANSDYRALPYVRPVKTLQTRSRRAHVVSAVRTILSLRCRPSACTR